jgi:hypothetical protein
MPGFSIPIVLCKIKPVAPTALPSTLSQMLRWDALCPIIGCTRVYDVALSLISMSFSMALENGKWHGPLAGSKLEGEALGKTADKDKWTRHARSALQLSILVSVRMFSKVSMPSMNPDQYLLERSTVRTWTAYPASPAPRRKPWMSPTKQVLLLRCIAVYAMH